MAPYWAEDLALTAKAMGEESRARMLLALLDGRAWTAAELADCAGITRGTATTHLNHLAAAGLLEEVRQGRHRYVRLKNMDVADAIEAMVRLSPRSRPLMPRSYQGHKHGQELKQGRTCYRHLAGALGVAVTRQWRDQGIIGADWTLTGAGRLWADSAGLQLPEKPGRALARPCLDWTERVDHAAGLFAELFVQAALERRWLERGAHPRAIRLTAKGTEELQRVGLVVPLGSNPTLS
ncbi:transcriptional regulator [Arthrobacter sp. NtRootA9]|nr:transcriptional regulator [Arthrobacter sp. NtRootA9]